MKVSMTLSVKGEQGAANFGPMFIGRQAAVVCASHNLAATIVPIFSSITSDKENQYHIESGCRVELLSDLPRQRAEDVLYLFKALQDALGIYCVWLDVLGPSPDSKALGLDLEYHGCILEWGFYLLYSRLIHARPMECNPSDNVPKSYNKDKD